MSFDAKLDAALSYLDAGPKPRTYACWVKGNRLGTEERIVIEDGRGRLAALFRYANRRGLKTFQCDAVWIKEEKA